MSGQSSDERLAAIQRRLEETEAELAQMGYASERMVTHPGALVSQQLLEQEILILVLLGLLRVEREGVAYELGPGERIRIPSGVPFSVRAGASHTVYWIHAQRLDAPHEKREEPLSN